MTLPLIFVESHLLLNFKQPLFNMFLHIFKVLDFHGVLALNLIVHLFPFLSLCMIKGTSTKISLY